MEKDSSENIICVKCSKPAKPGSNPPLCPACSELEKTAKESDKRLREFADEPGEAFNGVELS